MANNSVGRPTKYRTQYILEVDKYLKKCQDRKYEFHETRGKVNVFRERREVKLPSIEGFALHLKVSRKVLYDWKEKRPAFKKALQKIEMIQKERLMNEGLAGNYSPVIAKLILSSNHGMKEKSDVTTDDKPIENTFSDEQVNRIAERIARRKGSDDSSPSEK